MKSIISTLKDIIETQQQFTALPPTQMQGYQHHQFMPLTNQGQQVWPVAVQQIEVSAKHLKKKVP